MDPLARVNHLRSIQTTVPDNYLSYMHPFQIDNTVVDELGHPASFEGSALGRLLSRIVDFLGPYRGRELQNRRAGTS